MIAVGITQRALPPNKFGERRDALDLRWSRFLASCGLVGVPLPNDPELALRNADGLGLQGIVLSGGESLSKLGGDSPHRDETEQGLLHWAISNRTPVIGICRGMQLIVDTFGATLSRVHHHAGTRHEIIGNGFIRIVNSYHEWAVTDVDHPLVVTARHGDVVESVRHLNAAVIGMMWHPERERSANQADISLFRQVFGAEYS